MKMTIIFTRNFYFKNKKVLDYFKIIVILLIERLNKTWRSDYDKLN